MMASDTSTTTNSIPKLMQHRFAGKTEDGPISEVTCVYQDSLGTLQMSAVTPFMQGIPFPVVQEGRTVLPPPMADPDSDPFFFILLSPIYWNLVTPIHQRMKWKLENNEGWREND